tara:strand:+ start:331 stop:873 length:543 start_codon:yes stop_codon:yes gene_type:complete
MEEKSDGGGLSSAQMIIISFIVMILVGISFMIKDKNLKISYILIVGLAIFTLFNVYMTIKYYNKLRNTVGEPGPQGPKGPKGPQGEPGNCTFSEKCGIDDAKNRVINEIEMRREFEEFFENEAEYNVFLNYLRDNQDGDNITENMKQYKLLVNEIILNAKTTKIEQDDYFNKVFKNPKIS